MRAGANRLAVLLRDVNFSGPAVFHSDGGHGWLEVPMVLVVAALRQAKKARAGRAAMRPGGGVQMSLADMGVFVISRCSYQSLDGSTAYLEEDCDVRTFQRALADLGVFPGANLEPFPFDISDRHHPGRCFIRDLPRYSGGGS